MEREYLIFAVLLLICWVSFTAGLRMNRNPESQVTRMIRLVEGKQVFDRQLFFVEKLPGSGTDLLKTDAVQKSEKMQEKKK